jgi:hypothetical protein
VHLIALTDDSDALSAFVVLVPDASGSGGSIIWSLGELVVDVDGTPTAITDVYKAEGLEGARAQFEKVLGFGATDATIIAPKDIAAIAAPLGTISIKNPDPVSVDQKGKRVVKFAAGTLELDPDEIGEYLTIRGAGEAPTNRGSRADIVLSALAAKLIDASDAGATSSSNSTAAGASTTAPAAADGSVDIGGVLASTGASPDFIVLPMTRQSFKGSYLYSPDADGITDQLAGVVQFPVSSFPGQRPRVRVLNGTSAISAANSVAPQLARAGGEVLLVGNANPLDVETSTVVYSDESFKGVADRIAEIVGVTAVRTDDISDAADIDVVLGADYQP